MHDYSLFQDLTILLLVSLPINLLFHRIQLPSTMGFLVAGILIGPNGLSWIGHPDSVNNLAEIGVVLLLFVIGLEFSLSKVLKSLAGVAGSGSIQILLTSAVVFLICREASFPTHQSLFIGLLIAFSSTAIVIKMLTDSAELDTMHGRLSIGILLFQDICVVPTMAIIPLLAQADQSGWGDLVLALLKALAAIASIFLISRWVVPRALHIISTMGSKENLTLFVIFLILGTGWLSQSLGLSLAMGAFIAGLILAETEYSYQIILDILPLRDYFVSIFFIATGMLLDFQQLLHSFPFYLGITLLVILFKTVITSLASLAIRNPLRVSLITGFNLSQVGEFSLVMAGMALSDQLISPSLFQSLLIVSILSMLISPIIIQNASALALGITRIIAPKLATVEPKEEETSEKKPLKDHVIIVGYGLGGRHLSKVLQESSISYIVIDQDSEQIKQALSEGVSACYGDVTQRENLHRAGIESARMIVFLTSDYFATTQGVKLARQLNPQIYVMVRTRYASQADEVTSAGANQVIPEEFETSIEIFSRVLKEYHIPNNIIEQQIELVRLEGYAMFRGVSFSAESLGKFSTYLTASLTESFHILDSSWVNKKMLKDLAISEKSGVTLLAVVRDQKVHAHPEQEFRFQEEDIIILFGSHAQLDKGLELLQKGPG